MKKSMLSICVLLLLAPAVPAAEPTVKTLATGLNNPAGLALCPGSGEIFVSDSGAGRIVTVKDDGTVTAAVTGFPRDSYGKGPKFDIGPLGLVFVGKDLLAVGDGGSIDGEEYVRLYELTGKEMTIYDSKYKLGPILPSKQAGRGEGNFYGVAATAKGLYITSNGDDTKGWVLMSALKEGVPGDLKTFIPSKEQVKVDAPVAIAISPDNKLVIGQMGEVAAEPDSLLTVYNEATGALELKAELEGVFDICSLAYHPKSGKLYGVDFNWPVAKPGSLIRIDVKKQSGAQGTATVTKIMELDKPTAMAFGAMASLYVTVIGTAEKDATDKPGKLLKITGEF